MDETLAVTQLSQNTRHKLTMVAVNTGSTKFGAWLEKLFIFLLNV